MKGTANFPAVQIRSNNPPVISRRQPVAREGTAFQSAQTWVNPCVSKPVLVSWINHSVLNSVRFRAVNSLHSSGQAKTYNRVKLGISITSSVLTFLLMVVLVLSGASTALAEWSTSIAPQRYISLLLFVVVLGLAHSAIALPLSFFSGYIVEHRYGLSNQSTARWAWEHGKGMMVGAPLALCMVMVLYLCLEGYGPWWWLPVGTTVTLLSVVLARLAPTLILPLFYRFRPVDNGPLKERIHRLCRDAGLHIEGIFTFDLSKNTRKANAAFTGIGKSRRIILGDTLMQEFSEDEIETVFAHELGHYYYHHVRTGILLGIVSTFAGLYIAARLYSWSMEILGFSSLTDLGILPLLGVWLSLFALLTSPLGNALSRRHERQADSYAVSATGNPGAFASALRKLAEKNLADPEPHPVIEFLFYSHPSISQRLTLVEATTRG
jgi:STE24 endopeptidase